MELTVFDEVADALSGLVPRPLGRLRYRAHRYGIKVWFDDETPTREHYEAQVVRGEGAGASTMALEVGFHAEYPTEADNEAVIRHLLRAEPQWRPLIGDEPVAGAFLGRDSWRRVSELWPDPDLEDGELSFAVAARLTDYITALEPIRRTR